MTRPETIEDVDAYDRKAHVFIHVDPPYLTLDVEVGAALLKLIAAARNSDLFDVSEDGEFKVSVPLTEVELAQRLENAQRSWDYTEKDYEKVCDGERVESWRRHAIDRWAKDEGKPDIDWNEYDRFREGAEA